MASFVKVGLLLVVVVVFAGLNLSAAKIYTVGDSIGWTILNSPNYTAWAAGKPFREGDTVYFKYNKQFHNVLEVSKADYNSCKSSSPSATYSTGNDSITIKTAGHHYFICGIPGHCQIGQKVDIFVGGGKATAPASSAAPSPSLSPAFIPSTAPSASAAQAPSSGAQLPLALSTIIEVATMTSAIVLMGL
ncbi:mavicyanin [Dendrobium catenatum]|uniref:Mavicyanin n=1 Tax=Dendrobium catenatum TaxID=906689 RepID=A0A2I0XJK4_9ASPA|nr:mavicyanin [Dendrobium catenatum]PKU88106.1 Mavicyanin [Dendrobium catenatum]